jgi:small conductance mechanosensitive channel
MKIFPALFQDKEGPKFIQKTEPIGRMDFGELYNMAINWLMVNGPRILIALIVFLVGQWLIKLFRKWLHKVLFRKDVESSVRPFIESLIIAVIQIVFFIFVMQIIGVELTVFAAGIASVGVAIGLALSGTLQNFACGLLILFLKPFKVGDRIIAQGQEGDVESIQIFYTIVRNKDNRTVIIPNSKLSNEVIVKFDDAGNSIR